METRRIKYRYLRRAKQGFLGNCIITGFELKNILPRYVQGIVNAKVKIFSPENFSNLQFKGNLQLFQGKYFIGLSKSRYLNANMNSTGNLEFKPQFAINFSNINITAQDNLGRFIIDLETLGRMDFKGRSFFRTTNTTINLDYDHFRLTMPAYLERIFRSFSFYLSTKTITFPFRKRETFRIKASQLEFFYKKRQYFKITGDGNIVLPAINVYDLNFQYDVEFTKEHINIEQISINALKKAAYMNIQGKYSKIKSKTWQDPLNFKFAIVSQDLLELHQNIALKGLVAVEFHIENNKLKGFAQIDGFYMNYKTLACSRAIIEEKCKIFYLNNLNLNYFPFEHDRSTLLSNDFFKSFSFDSSNIEKFTQINQTAIQLSLSSFASTHGPRGEPIAKKGKLWYYIGEENFKEEALKMRLSYQDNILLFPSFQIKTFDQSYKLFKVGKLSRKKILNTQIEGKGMYLYLADGSFKKMKFGIQIQAHNIDLSPFLPKSLRPYSGIVNTNIFYKINSFENTTKNMECYISFYEIKEGFSGFVLGILLSQTNSSQFYSWTLSQVDVTRALIKLQEGLVYVYIYLKRYRSDCH